MLLLTKATFILAFFSKIECKQKINFVQKKAPPSLTENKITNNVNKNVNINLSLIETIFKICNVLFQSNTFCCYHINKLPFITINIFLQVSSADNSELYIKCAAQYCVPKSYNKHTIPRIESADGPIEVILEFYDLDILKVDDKEFTITLQAIMLIQWMEPRLVGPNNTHDEASIPLDTNLLDYLWFTNLFIYNLKEIRKYKVLQKGKDSIGT